jgi:uncharacterized membrane protein
VAGGKRTDAADGGGHPAGAGGFNLYDGIVQHKLLGLHQVRAGASDNLPYDVAFVGLAAVVLLAGLLLLRAAGLPNRSAASR